MLMCDIMYKKGQGSYQGQDSYYVAHFPSSVYDFIAITKYKITTLLIFLNVYTCPPLSVITRTVHTLSPSTW